MADLAEARELARLVVRLSETARAHFAAAVAEVGVPVLLARTILLVDGRTPMRDVADELGCDPSYVTGIADQLESRGLARRAIGKDRRVKVLELTDVGAELQTQVAEAVDRRGPFGHQLTAEQRRTLRELLELLLSESVYAAAPNCTYEEVGTGASWSSPTVS
ncbi:MarR family winged helix-turn-helix transcriptional regulator [Microbacterium sp. ASV49]|uniref:HTH marR-type domain-containing protein n=1 Tax=Microbacterium candidum TaxID=3041922 RepID=A0ABT7MWN2_9MICO|nr:hypothetical protein [Microbacterium sp. ASV49]MDL9978861.1 hypothetical protein [Microbacterium sp. ASV49]